ncbi:MAG: hypothetical protein K2M60_06655 [Lachnospiraceae bacterium]|nr:hypothetical protein [Lachnospiraceae bacterium]MDE6254346.1 hypothetical protein [Lachnospiraceae bacterium]
MKKLQKALFTILILIMITFVSACIKKSNVETVIVPEDAVTNEISGKYKNSSDDNIWQFNADGSLLITSNSESAGQYDVKYKDSSMYLINVDGAAIEFYYFKKDNGNIEITINGKNADTSELEPIEEQSDSKN